MDANAYPSLANGLSPTGAARGRGARIMNEAAMDRVVQLGDVVVGGDRLEELCLRYHVKELSLFGSAARGEMGPESDIDVMVEFEPGVRIGLIKFESLAEELEALTGRKVDLVTKGGLKPWIRPHALKDARVLYAA